MEATPRRLRGGNLLARALLEKGVEHVFTLSGGFCNPALEGFMECGMRVVNCPHEQVAGHLADAHTRLTRKPAVCLVGPEGFANAVPAMMEAWGERSPVIFVTGKDHEDDEATGFELGAVDYIRKPFHSVVVRARVMNHLKLKLQSDVLREMAMLDGLTGIPNRRSFDERFETIRAHALREQRPLSLLMIDVDYFKKYNDLYGHLRGDQCLRDVAQALNDNVRRPHDLVGRFGGEEFAVLLPDTAEAGALTVAEQLHSAIARLGIEHRASDVADRVSLSIGAATRLPTSTASLQQHLQWADEQLYRAKSEGRNRTCIQSYGD